MGVYNLTTVYNSAVHVLAVSCPQTVTQAGGKLMQECRKHVLVNEISQRNVMQVGGGETKFCTRNHLKNNFHEFEIHVLVVGRRGEGQRREQGKICK